MMMVMMTITTHLMTLQGEKVTIRLFEQFSRVNKLTNHAR